MKVNLGMEQEFLSDNAFIRHPARCHVCKAEMKSSFNFTFDIIYTIDLITLCSSPLTSMKRIQVQEESILHTQHQSCSYDNGLLWSDDNSSSSNTFLIFLVPELWRR